LILIVWSPHRVVGAGRPIGPTGLECMVGSPDGAVAPSGENAMLRPNYPMPGRSPKAGPSLRRTQCERISSGFAPETGLQQILPRESHKWQDRTQRRGCTMARSCRGSATLDQDSSLDEAHRFENVHPCLRSSTIATEIRFRS
jgi:hypothetical protein